MSEVVENYFEPLYEEIVSAKKSIVEHIDDETVRLKETLKEQIKKVEKILAKKLNLLDNSCDARFVPDDIVHAPFTRCNR